jgi:hypothetical protein
MKKIIVLLLVTLASAYAASAVVQFEFDQPEISAGFDFSCSYKIEMNPYNITSLDLTASFNSSREFQCPPILKLFYTVVNITSLAEPNAPLTDREQEMLAAGFDYHCSYNLETNRYNFKGSTISAYYNSEDDFECPPILDLNFENVSTNYNTQEEQPEASQEPAETPQNTPTAQTPTPVSKVPAPTPSPTMQSGSNAAWYWVIGIVVVIIVIAVIYNVAKKK